MQCRARESMSWFAITNTLARINTGVHFDTRLCSHTDLVSHADMRARPLIQTRSHTQTTHTHANCSIHQKNTLAIQWFLHGHFSSLMVSSKLLFFHDFVIHQNSSF